jgi:hypothetical protein
MIVLAVSIMAALAIAILWLRRDTAPQSNIIRLPLPLPAAQVSQPEQRAANADPMALRW